VNDHSACRACRLERALRDLLGLVVVIGFASAVLAIAVDLLG
jgi:hypothetical protein